MMQMLMLVFSILLMLILLLDGAYSDCGDDGDDDITFRVVLFLHLKLYEWSKRLMLVSPLR